MMLSTIPRRMSMPVQTASRVAGISQPIAQNDLILGAIAGPCLLAPRTIKSARRDCRSFNSYRGCPSSRISPPTSAATRPTRSAKRYRSSLNRGSIRTRSSWHRPGCTWVNSEDSLKATTPRDEACEACQELRDEPYEYSMRERLWQQKRDLLAPERIKAIFGNDAYEMFFGLSNRRIRSLWNGQAFGDKWDAARPASIRSASSTYRESLRTSVSVMASMISSTTRSSYPRSAGPPALGDWRRRDVLARCCDTSKHSPASASNTGDSGKGTGSESLPVIGRAVEKAPGKTYTQPQVHASFTWSSSKTDSQGVRHVSSGKLMYDPISGRMVPSDISPAEPASTPQKSAQHPEAAFAKPVAYEKSAHTAIESRFQPSIQTLSTPLSTNDTSKKPVSPTPEATLPEKVPKLESSLDRYALQDTRPQISRQASSPLASYQAKLDKLSQFERMSKQELNTAEAKASPRQADSDVGITAKAQQPNDSRRRRAEAWVEFNNAQRSKQTDSVVSRTTASRTEPIHFDGSTTTSRLGQPQSGSTVQQPAAPRSWQNVVRRNSPSVTSVLRKDKPLRSMTHVELNRHKAALLRSWEPKAASAAPSPADRHLEAEVIAQKQAMTSFVDKWRYRQDSSQHSKSTKTPDAQSFGSKGQVSSRQNDVDLIAGEGDMCPNVVDFAKTNRWYKRKAPHALQSTDQATRDRELVRSIRSVYENAYGTIKIGHEQQAIHRKSTAPDTEATSGVEIDTEGEKAQKTTRKLEKSAINPIDGTTQPQSYPVPPIGNYASPTGFVNYDVWDAQTRFDDPTPFIEPIKPAELKEPAEQAQSANSTSSATSAESATSTEAAKVAGPAKLAEPVPLMRDENIVKKQEEVFSGNIPVQKYSIQEIQEFYNKQGFKLPVGAPEAGSFGGAGNGRNGSGSSGTKRKQNRKSNDQKPKRGFKRIVLAGTWVAACCYATGVLIELYRVDLTEPPNEPGNPPRRDATRGDPFSGLGFFSRRQERSAREIDRQASAKRSGAFDDMPLRGFEYPLVGLLTACVWYLIWGGTGGQ